MNASEDFVTTRLFNAPRELVFDVWTQEQHLSKWFAPKGFDILGGKMDLRVGGTYHYGLRTPDGMEMWGKWTFKEIKRPEKLVVITSFSDRQGGITVHPGNPNWPRETLATTTFESQGPRTLLTLRWAPYNATDLERRTFAENKASMEQGWGGTMELLERYLDSLEGDA
ncbi:MAG TPA: SRPBCC domain-containing protein [Gammaproteobacteria bacterium]|jgi:uncharacterized protein YndB with AHSA1/START domain|nr:SRPBCC domain-containing protein [Gammaproteobacteria bacterium]